MIALRLLPTLFCALPALALAQGVADPTGASAQGDVAVTIYNDNLALVQDVRQVDGEGQAAGAAQPVRVLDWRPEHGGR